jgi:hypothetical protein
MALGPLAPPVGAPQAPVEDPVAGYLDNPEAYEDLIDECLG